MTITPNLLENKISELLDIFYSKRSIALNDLKLINTLKRKNPYLYRAVGVSDASEIVEEILRAHVSSFDETLFGSEESVCKRISYRFFQRRRCDQLG